ncbi:hypothetical protein VTN77DRAFT_4463 [Rasamsonia byssochlamydoides]|uniref:uncharacterized protein n=1 Tax=Rasamsonia byssochlamydoides TaxID=89139 RepID=UPI0037435C03
MKVVYYLIATLSAARVAYAAPVASQVDATYFFTFGNSYTSTGFSSNSTQPSATNPMGNPVLGSGTSSGGMNWVGYLTTVFNNSLVLNYDLAVSGACINNSIVSATVHDLVWQVELNFVPTYGEQPDSARWTAESAVFAFWIGINDIGHSYQTVDPSNTVPVLMDSFFNLVVEVYAAGARQFLFLQVPPTTRSPLIIENGNIPAHAAYVALYNQQLEMRIEMFKETFSDVTVVYYKAWDFMTNVLDHPGDYGFHNETCIGDGCVWYNNYHPTAAFHELMAKDMAPKLKAFQNGW